MHFKAILALFFSLLLTACANRASLAQEPDTQAKKIYPTHILATSKGASDLMAANKNSLLQSPSDSDLFFILGGTPVAVVGDTYFISRFASDAKIARFYKAFSEEDARRILSAFGSDQPKKDGSGTYYLEVKSELYVVKLSGFQFRCNSHPHVRDNHMGVCPVCGMQLVSIQNEVPDK
jgi:hypothetical protein